MPISDLLAEITGEKATASSAPSAIRTSTAVGLKRKADDDANTSTSIKTPRTQQNGAPPRSSLSRKPSPTTGRLPNPTTKSSTSQAGQRSASAAPVGTKPYAGTATANRQSGGPPPARRDLTERPKAPSSTAAASKIAPARPSPTTSNAPEPSKAPKKGSFAEIMARGAKAQQIMPKAGIIQHKALEKPQPKKEREKETTKGVKRPGANGTSTKGPAQGGALQMKGSRTVPRNGAAGDAKSGSKSRPTSSGSDAPEKKKKGPVMTGYSGTARSAPPSKKSASSGKGPASRRTPGGLLAPPKAARRDRYDDEYDEELDDFVVDDEDEDNPYARQYGYASDGSSDMEAGMDDIYDEESRAERAARLEDRREEKLLEELKRQKEEKKKRSGIR
ncbi:spt2 chromatin [Apiospora sp. TS-2023a]